MTELLCRYVNRSIQAVGGGRVIQAGMSTDAEVTRRLAESIVFLIATGY